MLTLNHVSVSYGEEEVVRDLSLTIKDREHLVIIGPNGCGKTTLLKAMTGLLPYRGAIEIDGQSIADMHQKDIALKMAMLSQISGIYFSYSVFDTVMMGRYPHRKDGMFGRPSKEDIECVRNCLLAVNLLAEQDKEITKLSGGQLQRVFLARTLAQQPEIILLDEPTNHLDLKYQIELIDYLKDWAGKNGCTVIGVLHDVNLAMRLSDDVMVMKEGRIAAYGKAGEVLTGRLLKSVYEIDVAGYMLESLGKWTER